MVSAWFVPVRISRAEQESAFQTWRVSWTPTIVTIGPDGQEYYRFTGFLSPDDLCARLILDGAKTELDLKNYDLADKCLRDVVEKYGDTYAAAEGVFYQGVAAFLQSRDPKFLRNAVDKLKQKYPQSEWTLRAKPYELINV